jgi:putative ABC transport system permease protein
MGRPLLVWRLVIGDIRRRRVQSALLLVMIATTTTTLTLGLALHRVTQSPFARTRAATKGPDAVVEIGPGQGAGVPAPDQFAALIHAPRVIGTAGPFPVAFVSLSARGIDIPIQAEGRDLPSTAIDQPLLTAGHWVRSGEVVIEQGLADTLGLHLGDAVSLGARRFTIAGVALTTAQAFYPATTPGLVWLTRTDSERLGTAARPVSYLLDVKLANPTTAPAFNAELDSAAFNKATTDEPTLFDSWQDIRASDYRAVAVDRKVLLIASWLLAMLAIASIAVVVGGRMTEQTRRAGLLKAVGGTPALIAVVLLAENLLLALAAALIGLLAGALLTPVLADPGNGLLGSSTSPPLAVMSIVLVIAAAMAVATAATLIPAIRAARMSTIRALYDPPRPPRRRTELIAMSAGLPVPLLLGLRLMARRTRRTVLTAASLTIAVTMAVATLTLQHNVDVHDQPQAQRGFLVTASIGPRVTHLVFILSVILATLAATNAIFTTWATAIDAQRPTALARALGATPPQIAAALTCAQLLPAFAAACLGIPVGLGLYALAARGPHATPQTLPLLAVVPATVALVALLTAVPARIGAHRPIAAILAAD